MTRKAIQADPARDRLVLDLRAEGKSLKQIAKHLKVRESRVKQLLARGRKQQAAAMIAVPLAAPGGAAAAQAIAPVVVMPTLGKRGGLDLDAIAALRREGLDTASDIARVLGVPA